jgi:hypothetical protein
MPTRLLVTYSVRKGTGTHITKWELETSSGALIADLEGNLRIRVGGSGRRHVADGLEAVLNIEFMTFKR